MSPCAAAFDGLSSASASSEPKVRAPHAILASAVNTARVINLHLELDMNMNPATLKPSSALPVTLPMSRQMRRHTRDSAVR